MAPQHEQSFKFIPEHRSGGSVSRVVLQLSLEREAETPTFDRSRHSKNDNLVKSAVIVPENQEDPDKSNIRRLIKESISEGIVPSMSKRLERPRVAFGSKNISQI